MLAYSIIKNDNELLHYGVKGMKWGKRKPKNQPRAAMVAYPLDEKNDPNDPKKIEENNRTTTETINKGANFVRFVFGTMGLGGQLINNALDAHDAYTTYQTVSTKKESGRRSGMSTNNGGFRSGRTNLHRKEQKEE